MFPLVDCQEEDRASIFSDRGFKKLGYMGAGKADGGAELTDLIEKHLNNKLR